MINTTNDFINVIENEEKEKDYLAEPILKVLGIIILFGLSIVMGILPLKLYFFIYFIKHYIFSIEKYFNLT